MVFKFEFFLKGVGIKFVLVLPLSYIPCEEIMTYMSLNEYFSIIYKYIYCYFSD